ncbi:uncharacterized protein IWZ02DRAFT_60272 [Phyllosticta citriasiana]|uniref:uncharacterized protein n=1 Tax=Phyllosticta citriasiana TaxID=595635 RepID=UPI0030FDED1B
MDASIALPSDIESLPVARVLRFCLHARHTPGQTASTLLSSSSKQQQLLTPRILRLGTLRYAAFSRPFTTPVIIATSQRSSRSCLPLLLPSAIRPPTCLEKYIPTYLQISTAACSPVSRLWVTSPHHLPSPGGPYYRKHGCSCRWLCLLAYSYPFVLQPPPPPPQFQSSPFPHGELGNPDASSRASCIWSFFLVPNQINPHYSAFA